MRILGFQKYISLTALQFLVVSGTIEAGIVLNPSFELPTVASGTFITVQNGETLIPNWTVGRQTVDVVNNEYGPAFNGANFIDLIGSPGPGELSQVLILDIGTEYQLSFAYSNHVSSPLPTATARVFGALGDLLVPQQLTHSTSTFGNLDWSRFNSTFVATESSVTLEFRSTSGGLYGILIDDVSVVTTVPEASSFALVVMCGSTVIFRRRFDA